MCMLAHAHCLAISMAMWADARRWAKVVKAANIKAD